MQIQYDTSQDQQDQREQFHIRVPFLSGPVGLGSVIAGMTQAVGIEPCAPCQQRKEAMDRRVVFDPWRT